MPDEHLEDLSIGAGKFLGDKVDLVQPCGLILLLHRLQEVVVQLVGHQWLGQVSEIS